jgi:hypothetical protein
MGGIFAQNSTPRNNSFLVFLHGGYGYLPSKTKGLTSADNSYVKKMSSGAAWNAQLYFKHKMLIVGLMYSGYTSKGKLENTSDNIFGHYIAPQIGMHIPVAKVFSIGFNGGMGGMIYRNKSEVYQNPRLVTGSAFGVNLGVRGIFNINEHWGISAEIMSIIATLGKTNVNYHSENILVRYFPQLSMTQLTFSLGIKYSL